MVKIEDTVQMMTSTDFKERLKAEYWQTKIRYERCHKALVKRDKRKRLANIFETDKNDDVTFDILKEQEQIMMEYLYRIELRAEIEGVDLDDMITENC